MARSYDTGVGDGIKTAFPFSFAGEGYGYISSEDIVVEVDLVPTVDFEFTGPNQVTFDVAPDDGAAIRIRRVMDKETIYALFDRGNDFTKDKVNNNLLQMLYTLHEFLDGFTEEDVVAAHDLIMGGFLITGLGDGIALQDAVTVSQLTAAEAAVAISAAAALVSETNAAASEVAAANSAVNAAADAVSTAADLVATNQDTIDTAADAVATAANLVATNQDTIDTAADLVLTNQDAIDTAADAVSTAADLVATNQDTIDTAADAVDSAASAAAAAASAASIVTVNNMLALVGITGQADGSTAEMLGYFVIFPQAEFSEGGTFVWQAGLNKNLANGGTIIDPATLGGFDGTTSTLPAFLAAQGTGSGSGCWVRQYNSTFNVKVFGAIGDGTTDDSVAFVAAVNFCDGDTLYVPAGDYLLETIETIDNITPAFTADLMLRGDGSNSTTIRGKADKTSVMRVKKFSKIHMQGISFVDWESVVYTPPAQGTAYNISEVLIEACIFEDISIAAVVLANENGIENVRITNNIFRNISGAGAVAGIWIGSESESSQVDTSKIIITGNIFENITSTGAGEDAHGVILWGEELIVSDNTFRNIHNFDYSSGSEAIYGKTRYSTITGNVIIDAGYSESCINLKGAGRGVTGGTPQAYAQTIANNILLWTSATQSERRGIYVRSDNILIKGNYIENASYGIYAAQEAQTDKRVSIIGNYLKNTETWGIYLTNIGGDALFVKNNIIENITSSGGTAYPIRVEIASATDLVQIVDNTIRVDDSCTTTGEVRSIQVGATAATLGKVIIERNTIDIINTTAVHTAIKLTGTADISKAIITDNTIPIIPGTDHRHYAKYISYATKPAAYFARNNGLALDETNILERFFTVERVFTYDFNYDPNGTVVLGYIPENAVITRVAYNVRIQPVAGASASMALSIHTDDTAGLKAAVVVTDASWAAGWHDGIQDGLAANYSNTTTDIRHIDALLVGADLTAGLVDVYITYVMVP